MLTLALLVFTSVPCPSDDWPQFMGPSGTNTVELAGASFDWAKKPPKVLWRTALGAGFGGASVQGGEVFVLDRDPEEFDVLRVFRLADGEELWREGYEAKGRLQFPGSRSVPTVRGDLVYTVGGFGQVTCFDRKAKAVKWSVGLQETYEGELPMFGWSCSPLLWKKLVIVTALGANVGLVALDAETGKEAWVTEGLGYSHSTPAVLTLLDEPQIVFLSTDDQASGQDLAAPTRISSFDPDSGERLWTTVTTLTRLPVPAPLQIDRERLFVTGGYRSGSTMMRLAKKDGAYAVETLFHVERGSQIHLPLLCGGNLYMLANENWNDQRNRRTEGGLVCMDLDGKERWRTGEAPYFGRGSALLVGEHLLIQDGMSGVLRAVRCSPEGYRQVGEVDLFAVGDTRDHQMWAPMALADGKLLLRSQEELLCVQL